MDAREATVLECIYKALRSLNDTLEQRVIDERAPRRARSGRGPRGCAGQQQRHQLLLCRPR